MKHLWSLTKRATLGVTLLASIGDSLSQGSFVFDNGVVNGGPRAVIYGPDPGDLHRQQWGNTPDARVPGTQTYAGEPLAGTNYSVQAWYSLTPVSDVFQLVSDAKSVPEAMTTFSGGGHFSAYEKTIPDAILMVYLQVRTWDNAEGQLGTWDAAWNAALAGSGRAVGWSKVFEQPLAIGLVPYPGLVNLESFNAFIVPEPGTVSLAVLGGAVLLWGVRFRHCDRRTK